MSVFRGFNWITTRLFHAHVKDQRAAGNSGRVFLPEDVVMFEILTRLPAGDILKCRTVCKRWKSIISSPRFVETQAARAPSMIILHNFHRKDEPVFHLIDLDEEVSKTRMLHVGPLNIFRIVGSCNGLLLMNMRGIIPIFIVICSPLTRRRIFLLRRTRVDQVCGFFFSPLREIYKVIVASLVEPGEAHLGFHYRLLSFCVTSSSTQLVEMDDSTLLGSHSSVPTVHPAIYMNDSLHWVLKDRGSLEGCIMIVDTEREKMEFRNGPDCCSYCRFIDRYNNIINMRLLQMGDSLVFSHVSFDLVDLWILKDYGNWSWEMRHRVDLEQHLGSYHDRTLVEPSIIQNEELLLTCYKIGFFSFNLKTRRLRKLNVGVPTMIPYYGETIISTTYQDCLAGLDQSLSGFILSSRMTTDLACFPS